MWQAEKKTSEFPPLKIDCWGSQKNEAADLFQNHFLVGEVLVSGESIYHFYPFLHSFFSWNPRIFPLKFQVLELLCRGFMASVAVRPERGLGKYAMLVTDCP